MAQEIITYCILFVTTVIAVVRIYRFFTRPAGKCHACPLAGNCKVNFHDGQKISKKKIVL